jgi:hypothetical protein
MSLQLVHKPLQAGTGLMSQSREEELALRVPRLPCQHLQREHGAGKMDDPNQAHCMPAHMQHIDKQSPSVLREKRRLFIVSCLHKALV